MNDIVLIAPHRLPDYLRDYDGPDRDEHFDADGNYRLRTGSRLVKPFKRVFLMGLNDPLRGTTNTILNVVYPVLKSEVMTSQNGDAFRKCCGRLLDTINLNETIPSRELHCDPRRGKNSFRTDHRRPITLSDHDHLIYVSFTITKDGKVISAGVNISPATRFNFVDTPQDNVEDIEVH